MLSSYFADHCIVFGFMFLLVALLSYWDEKCSATLRRVLFVVGGYAMGTGISELLILQAH